jgi:predicted dinucleotide-binding enzyme
MVGQALAGKLVDLGHEVRMGSRQAGNDKAVAWAEEAGEGASEGSFADAASFGETIVNATAGAHSLEALDMAGAENLAGKVLIDVVNAIDFSGGEFTLTVANTDSLGEQIQRAHPDVRVVKALNTVNVGIMVAPDTLGEETNIFVCGNDAAAKAQVIELLETFGWLSRDIVDLGDITGARGMESYLHLWVRLWQTSDSTRFNIKIVRGD